MLRRFLKDEKGATAIEYGLIAALIAIAIVVGVIAAWSELKTISRFAELLTAVEGGGGVSGVTSARARLNTTSILYDWLSRSPLLGWGPGRAYGLDVADNQYMSWAVAWGALGVLPILFIGAVSGLKLLRVARTAVEQVGILSLGASICMMLVTGDFMENYRLFFITVMILQTIYERSASVRSGDRALVETDQPALFMPFRPQRLDRAAPPAADVRDGDHRSPTLSG